MTNSYFEAFIGCIKSEIDGVQKGNDLQFQKDAEIYYYEKVLQVATSIYSLEKNNSDKQKEIIDELQRENEELRKQLQNIKCGKMKTARTIISEMIAEKVNNSVGNKLPIYTKSVIKREILGALKWKLQVRYADDLKEEHITIAKEFIQNYKIDDFYMR